MRFLTGLCLIVGLMADLAGLRSVSADPASAGQSASAASREPATQPAFADAKPVSKDWLLHLPGIGGERSIDLAMTRGFKQGGFNGQVDIYDWTEHDTGLNALIAYQRNHKEAKLIAQKITERFDKDPSAAIYVSCHSGGGGLAIWALEDLPERVKITSLLMMSPALSPAYNLTSALRHVSGKAYVFSSLEDVLVLETGCKMLGTIDGVKTPAAGFGGFVRPESADAGQYTKLMPMPYNPLWIQYDDYGNHVGGMTRMFARTVLAPLVLSGKLPPGVTDAAAAAPAGQGLQ